jgi:23S rRNA (pseudouridine1915-N3)-methyltransferase
VPCRRGRHPGGTDTRLRIALVCIGKVRPPFADDVAHYERLLRPQARLETGELPEGKGDPAQAMASEARALLRCVPDRAYLCALDRTGEEMPSERLAEWLEDRRQAGRDLVFALGGAFGLDPTVLARADHRLSLGAATLPHQLARVVLLEQLFRAHKLINHEPYHY